jgi:signal transduction histidine kinase
MRDTRHLASPGSGAELPRPVAAQVAERWQGYVDLLSELLDVPAALVRSADAETLTVVVASKDRGNPFRAGERSRRGGLFCEIVLDLKREIALNDATGDEQLRRCAVREHGLVAYLGAPIANPGGSLFGTVAVLDRAPREFDARGRRLLLQFRDAIQADLSVQLMSEARRADEMLRGQAEVLEMIASGAPLAVTLAHIIGLIEAQMPDARCSILLLDEDGQHIRHGAAPSLPKDYVRAIEGLPIGPKSGSCGTAMYWAKPVVVSDIDTDPLWDDYRGLAVPHGLRACWSTPIVSPEGRVLGAFANYFAAPRTPTLPDTRIIDLAVHIAAIAIDSKRVEGKLRANEKRFRDFAETASDWFWETGTDHRLSYISHDVSAQPGADSFMGKTLRDIAVDGQEEPAKWQAHEARLDANEAFRNLVFRIERGEREHRFLSASGIPFFDASGRFAGYRGTARDVTGAVLANRSLIEAKDVAEVASKAKSEFLANMSHELRTPLNAIIGFADFIDQEPLGPLGAPRYLEYVRDIGRSGRHLLDIINDMLDVARIEAGKAALDESEFALADTIDDVVKIMARQAERAEIAVKTQIDPAVPEVRADARAMRQVLLNLVSNAVKFTPPGGTVTVTLAASAGGGIALAVADTGIGIAANDIPKLMQPFSQLDNVYRRKHQGAGLGLTLVRSFCELHGGTVAIQSEVGKGTIVAVTLPENRLCRARPAAAIDARG